MRVDIEKVRIGDTITISGCVTQIDKEDSDMPFEIDGVGWVMRDQIIGHTPRSIKPGDIVRAKGCKTEPGSVFEVIAVVGNFVWMRTQLGNRPITALVSEVENV